MPEENNNESLQDGGETKNANIEDESAPRADMSFSRLRELLDKVRKPGDEANKEASEPEKEPSAKEPSAKEPSAKEPSAKEPSASEKKKLGIKYKPTETTPFSRIKEHGLITGSNDDKSPPETSLLNDKDKPAEAKPQPLPKNISKKKGKTSLAQGRLFEPGYDTHHHSSAETDIDEEIDDSTWYLKINDNLIYGPMPIETLLDWVAVGRVTADSLVSEDREDWILAKDVPALKIDWLVEFENGEKHGPFNLQVAPYLIHQGTIKSDTPLYHRETGQQISVNTLLESEDKLRAPKADDTTAVHEAETEQPQPPTGKQPEKIQRLTNELTREKCRHEEVKLMLSKKESEHRTRIQEMTNQLGPQSEQLENTKLELNKLKEQHEILTKENSKYSKRIQELTNQLGPQSEQFENTKLELNKLKEQHSALTRQHETIKMKAEQKEAFFVKKNQELHDNLVIKSDKLETSTKELETLKANHSSLTQDQSSLIDSSRNKEERLNRRIEELTLQIHPQTEQIENLQSELKVLRQNHERLSTQNAAFIEESKQKEIRLSKEVHDWQVKATDSSNSLQASKREYDNGLENERVRQAKEIESLTKGAEKQLTEKLAEAARTREQDRIQQVKEVDRVSKNADEKIEQVKQELSDLREQERIRYVKELDKQARASAELIRQSKHDLDDQKQRSVANQRAGKQHVVDLQRRLVESEKSAEALKNDLDKLRSEFQKSVTLRTEIETREAKVSSTFQERVKQLQVGADEFEKRMKMVLMELEGQKEQYKVLKERSTNKEKDLTRRIKKEREDSLLLAEELDNVKTASQKEYKHSHNALREQDKKIRADELKIKDLQQLLGATSGELDSTKKETEKLKTVIKDNLKRASRLTKEPQTAQLQSDSIKPKPSEETKPTANTPEEMPPPVPVPQPEKTEKPKAPEMKPAASKDVEQWFLKLENLSVYGPVSLSELNDWCTQFRIGPHHEISRDKKTWKQAQNMPELKMDWIIKMADGTTYGPLNIEALNHLLKDGSVDPAGTVHNRATEESATVAEYIADALLSRKSKQESIPADDDEKAPKSAEKQVNMAESSPETPPNATVPPKMIKQQLQKRMTT